jgi:hypothetical protein
MLVQPPPDPSESKLPNPWSEQFWNLSKQSAFVKEYGLVAADRWARAAGTTLGAPRKVAPRPKAGPPGARGREGTAGTADEPAQEISTSGDTLYIDRSLGKHVRVLLHNDITGVVIVGWPQDLIRGSVVLEVYNFGTNNITGWPSGTFWNSGSAPTLTPDGIDCYVLFTSDGGNTIIASVAFMSA